jgi:hypothetical protein
MRNHDAIYRLVLSLAYWSIACSSASSPAKNLPTGAGGSGQSTETAAGGSTAPSSSSGGATTATTQASGSLSDRYSDDRALAADPAVLFHDDFETDWGTWDEPSKDTEHLFIEAGAAHAGSHYLRSTVTESMATPCSVKA